MNRDPLPLVSEKMTRVHLQFRRITLVTLRRMERGGGRQTQRQGGHISFLGLPLTNYNKQGEESGGGWREALKQQIFILLQLQR